MLIDNIPVPIEGEKNILEMVRKAGIELPTFCYYSELSVYGACRMCMVENERGGMEASCSTPPRAGMKVYTNTPKLRKHRKMILELLLSNHCRDCNTCDKNGRCKLQELANRFDIHRVRFENTSTQPRVDDSSPSITRDASKCILCGDCVRVCNEVQNVGAIDFAHRGSKMTVSCAFDTPIGESNCVGCGQCASVCPTGAIVVKDDSHLLWNELWDRDTNVVCQIAPAVRVAVAKEFGYKGENVMGKIVASLKRLGFNYVFDTATGADITVIEEATEFLERKKRGEGLPLFTSCCPAWVRFCEQKYPELLPNVSTCRSPMHMFAPVIAERFKDDPKRLVNVAIMPCTAKKGEAKRKEFLVDGKPTVDYVLTTQELIKMIKEAGICFRDIEPEAIDMPFGSMSGAGVIFGVTGGVTEAVIRYVSTDKSSSALKMIAYNGVRGLDGIKEFTVPFGESELKVACVSGLHNADTIIGRIKAGEHFDPVEVMACPNGCINGAGQPISKVKERKRRSAELYNQDSMCTIKSSEDNLVMDYIYNDILKDRAHELLHVHYCHE
jgi:NADH-quinone oxidoreductase subunit G